jgi:hypothetical protein
MVFEGENESHENSQFFSKNPKKKIRSRTLSSKQYLRKWGRTYQTTKNSTCFTLISTGGDSPWERPTSGEEYILFLASFGLVQFGVKILSELQYR